MNDRLSQFLAVAKPWLDDLLVRTGDALAWLSGTLLQLAARVGQRNHGATA